MLKKKFDAPLMSRQSRLVSPKSCQSFGRDASLFRERNRFWRLSHKDSCHFCEAIDAFRFLGHSPSTIFRRIDVRKNNILKIVNTPLLLHRLYELSDFGQYCCIEDKDYLKISTTTPFCKKSAPKCTVSVYSGSRS